MGGSDYAVDETDETPYEKRPVLSVVLVCCMAGYGLLSVTLDWLWVSDMLSVQPALVFGPASTAIIATMITISSIGTIGFTIEVGNMVYKTFYGIERLDEQVAQLITLFVEEVPSITLNWMLAACREVPMSYYQMTKAALAMLGAGLRVVRTLLSWFQKGQKRGLVPFILRIVVLSACAYVLIGSCLVFVFTYSDPGGETQAPPEGLGKSYDSDRYLYKAGVYFSHPHFQHCERSNRTGGDGGYEKQNWIKLGGVYDLQDADSASSDYYMINDTSYIDIKITIEGNRFEDCYVTDLSSCAITKRSSCSQPDNSTGVIHFEFGAKQPDKTLVFGDVTYQSAMFRDGQCTYLEAKEWGLLYENQTEHGQLQYYQIRDPDINDTYPFHRTNGEFVYYSNGEEFQNVTDVWKTGYFECDMGGTLYPNFDESIALCGAPCLHSRFAHITFCTVVYYLYLHLL